MSEGRAHEYVNVTYMICLQIDLCLLPYISAHMIFIYIIIHLLLELLPVCCTGSAIDVRSRGGGRKGRHSGRRGRNIVLCHRPHFLTRRSYLDCLGGRSISLQSLSGRRSRRRSKRLVLEAYIHMFVCEHERKDTRARMSICVSWCGGGPTN